MSKRKPATKTKIHYLTVAIEAPAEYDRANLVAILKKLIDAGVEAAGDTPDDFGDAENRADLELIEAIVEYGVTN